MKKPWNSNFTVCKIITNIFKVMPCGISLAFLSVFRYWDGNFGLSLRYGLYKNICEFVGENVKFHPGLYIYFPTRLSIGDNSTLHEFSVLECKGGIKIGSNTSIAHKFSMMSSTHLYSENGISFRKMGIESKFTQIGNDVWIGAGVVVTYGVDIGNNTIIGAQSLVNKNCENNSIYVGVPAKKMKSLK